MVELLAPAKNFECAKAAIDFGADAVYIGANTFGARQNATNTLEDIKQVVQYAHKFYAKVFCTVNTILDDNELVEAEKLINNLYEIGVDAIIIQDMGLLKCDLPPIPIHASTQCDNRTLDKIKFFENVGLERVILARELSIEQIQEICKNTNIEIETFIHGALCVSYSGQCYLSEFIGNRSSNRGCCAQPCRKKYTLIDEDGKILAKDKHLLCLKDFNASKYIEDLIKAGVTSFKIEGRLKDVNYIKNVVAYYRQLIDKFAEKSSSGHIDFDFTPDLNKSFNRAFTTFCLDKTRDIYNFDTPKSMGEKIGKITKVFDNYFEYNGKKLSNGDGICYISNGELEGFFVNKTDKNKVFVKSTKGLKIGQEIFRNFDIEFEKILKNSKTKRKINIEIYFENNILSVVDEDKNSVMIEVKAFEPAKNLEKMTETFIEQIKKTGETDFEVQNIYVKSDIPFLKISEINSIRREILEKLKEERLRNYKRSFKRITKVSVFPEKKKDYKANVFNKLAKEFYSDCSCEVTECAFEKNKQVKKLELMRSKHCLKRAFGLCGQGKKLFLIDEKNMRYEIKTDCDKCEMILTL